MTQYLVATGWDEALEDLDPIEPQPRTIGLQYARRQYAASGVVIDELAYVELEWSMLETAAEYQTLLAQFGLDTATTSEVSIYLQNENYEWILRNGIAVKPQIGSDGARNQFFLRDFTILVKALRAQA